MRIFNKMKKMLLVAAASLFVVNVAFADTAILSHTTMGANGVAGEKANAITGVAGSVAEGFTATCANAGKTLDPATGLTIDGTEYRTIKASNGAQTIVTLPEGKVATKLTLYSYTNKDAATTRTSYWKEICGVEYTKEELGADTLKCFKDYANPDVRTYTLDNVSTVTFTNTGEQQCFVALVEYEDAAAEPELPTVDSLKVDEVNVLVAGKTYVLGQQYDMYKVQFTAEKEGFLSITPSQKISSTSLKINGASSTFTKDANGGIEKKGMAAGSLFEGTFYCTGTPSAENVYELVVTFEEGTPYSPLALTLASPADGGEWSGAAQYKSYGVKGVPHYEFSTLISTDVKASVKIGEKVYENINLTVDGYNPKLDITALPDTLNKAIAAGLIKAGETFTLTLSNIVDKEFAANTLADQTFTYTLASTACTGVSPTVSTSRTTMVTDVTFSFDGNVALADTAKFYMVNLANNEVTELTGEVVEGTSVKVTVPAIEGLLPRLYNIVAEGVTTAEGDKVITYGNEPGKLVASYGTGNGFFKGTTSLQNWGQVYSLKGFTATYPGEVIAVEGIATKPISFVKVDETTGAEVEMADVTLGYTINGNVIEFALSKAITEVGTYRFSVPQKHFWAKDTYTEEDAKLSAPKYAYYQASITLTIDVVEPTATDVTDKLVNPNFDDATYSTGWTDGSAQLKGFGTSSGAVALKDGNIFVGNIVEKWESGNWTGDLAQNVKELPAGAYKFTMGAYANNAGEAYVFANDSLSLPLVGGQVGEYTVYAELAEGADLKVGVKNVSGINWIVMDNAHLYYYGEGSTVDMAIKADWKVLLAAVEELKAAYAAPIQVEALDAAVAAAKMGTAQEYLASAKVVSEAMATFKKVNDAEVAFQALAATLEGATAENPVDATGFIANPSFAGGKYNCDNGTGNGNLYAPEDWTVTYTNADWGWKNFQPATGGGQDGDQFFEFWAGTYHTLTLGQEVRLPAGSYTVSAALRTETAAQVTSQHVFVKIGEDVDSSAVLGAPIGDSWNAANAWQTLSVAFSLEEETVVTIGAGSTGGAGSAGWFQIDNFRLSCTGWVDPALAPAVDSLNVLIAEVEAYQKTLDTADATQASMSESLTQAITGSKAVAEAKESVTAVREAYNSLNMYYVQIKVYLAGTEAQAAQAMMAEYENPTDEAGLGNAINKVFEIVSGLQTGMGDVTYTLADLDAAVEAMRTAKEAFVKENTPATEPVVKMTYVDYDQPATAMGEIAAGATARAGFNKISEGSVAFGNTGWGENKITYIQVDASCYTGDIVSAELTVEVSGSTDSKRVTAWGIGYNSSVWSADMTYETADKTITTMGDLQSTSTKSASTFETKTFDILDAFKNDEDKVVTLVVYETAAAGGYIKNPVVAIEAANADEITTYTVKYVDEAGADIADAFTANIMIGEKAALTAEDKADKYNADNTKKYIYVSCDRDSIVTVADSASNVITATFREAATYNYTVEAVDDSGILARTLGSYSNFEGETGVKAPYNAYVLVEGTLYEAAKTGKEYNKYIDLTENNMKVQVVYTPTTIENVVYYQEAEDVEGLTLATNANTGVRSSNSASAYAAEADVVLTNLAAGKYTLTAVVCDTKSAMDAKFSFIAGTDTVLTTASSAVNWSSSTSKEFALAGETAISLAKGGNSMQAVDFVYIQKTGDVELPAKVAYLNKEGDTDDAIYDALVAGGYVVDDLAYADSTLTVEMIEANLAGYDVVVLGGSTGSGDNLAKTANLLLGKVNVLSTKSFWYKHYGTNGDNPGAAAAPSLSLAKAAGYEAHPIYAGIEGDEFAVFNDMGKENGRYLQSNGSFTDGPEQVALGTTNGADCIGEAWVDGFGYIIIPVDGLQPSGYLTADGAQLFVNAVEYLIAGEEYVAPVVPDAIEGVRVEATQWPADIYDLSGRMVKKAATSLEGLEKGLYIINGKKVLVK